MIKTPKMIALKQKETIKYFATDVVEVYEALVDIENIIVNLRRAFNSNIFQVRFTSTAVLIPTFDDFK